MERVTEYTRFHGGMLAVLKNSNRYSAIERLATIEDILGDDYDLDRLRQLVEADRDGRCVVLPVKEGDTVYHISVHPFEDCPPEIFDAPFHVTDFYEIGNTVFLTEEEAEASFEERDG